MFRRAWFTTMDDDHRVVAAAAFGVLLTLVAGVIGAAVARDDAGLHAFFSDEASRTFASRSAALQVDPLPRPLLVHRDLAPPRRDGGRPRLAKRDARTIVRQATRRRAAPILARRPAAVIVARSPGAPAVARLPALPAIPPLWPSPDTGRSALLAVYQDKTLRRGDAVMTMNGIRVFAGSRSFPYRPEDFRTVMAARKMDLPFRKALIELNRLPAFEG